MANFLHLPADEPGFFDPALEFSRYVYLLIGQDPGAIDEKISDQKAFDLALENLDQIFSQAGDKEKDKETVEGALNVVCWLFQRVLENNTAPAEAVTLVDKFLQRLRSDVSLHPLLRLKTMSTIYNILGGNGTARYNTFMAIVEYAAAAGREQFALVTSQLTELDNMLAEWGTDIHKTRSLYKVIFDSMAKHDSKDKAHQFRIKFLESFQGERGLDEAKEQANIAVVEAISDPKIYQYDTYLELDAIRALENDGKYGKTFSLLQLFSHDNLEGFNQFYGSNSSYVESLGLKKEECVLKMRLLTLCSLASNSKEIGYSEIAKNLQIQEAEVESWAIKAITAELMDAKMDQLNKVLVINHCKDRIFTKAKWTELRSKLVGWKDRIKQLMMVLENAKMQQQQQQMMQIQVHLTSPSS